MKRKIKNPLRRGVLDTTLCDEVCQWLATSRWFSPGTPVSSTSKTDRHDITEILLKVAINTVTHNPLMLFWIHTAKCMKYLYLLILYSSPLFVNIWSPSYYCLTDNDSTHTYIYIVNCLPRPKYTGILSNSTIP